MIVPNTTEYFDRYLYRYRAQPLRTIDGDTVVVLVDTGFYGRQEVHVRLEGYNAPEVHEDGGRAATLRLAAALTTGTGAWPLRLVSTQKETIVAQQMSFARYVGRIYVCSPSGDLVDVVELIS